MQREDTIPWYRQFWPWFIISIPAATVVAGVSTVFIAMQTSDSLVIKSDEDTQVAAQRIATAEGIAEDIGLAADIAIDAATGVIRLSLNSKTPYEFPPQLSLELSHPTLVARDASAELHAAMPDADGQPVWVGHLVSVPEGRYYIVISDGDQWRLSGEWSGETRLALDSSGD